MESVKEPVELDTSVVYEEDVEDAQTKFVNLLGVNGLYDLTGEFRVIKSDTHGILWYGDLNPVRIREVESLAVTLGFSVQIVN